MNRQVSTQLAVKSYSGTSAETSSVMLTVIFSSGTVTFSVVVAFTASSGIVIFVTFSSGTVMFSSESVTFISSSGKVMFAVSFSGMVTFISSSGMVAFSWTVTFSSIVTLASGDVAFSVAVAFSSGTDSDVVMLASDTVSFDLGSFPSLGFFSFSFTVSFPPSVTMPVRLIRPLWAGEWSRTR